MPGQGFKIPHASRPNKRNMKQKQCCNKLNKDFKNGSHQKKKKKKRKKRKNRSAQRPSGYGLLSFSSLRAMQYGYHLVPWFLFINSTEDSCWEFSKVSLFMSQFCQLNAHQNYTRRELYNRCCNSVADRQVSGTSWSWDKKVGHFRFIVCFLIKCLLLLQRIILFFKIMLFFKNQELSE